MILDFIRRHYRAYQWAKAVGLSSRGKIEEALNVAQSKGTQKSNRIHWRLFELHQLGLLNRHRETLLLSEEIIKCISSIRTLTPDQKYFLLFAQWYGLVSFSKIHVNQEIPERLKFDLSSLKLSDVSPYWKGVFPMPIHPEWRDDDLS